MAPGKLSALKVNRLHEPGMYGDGGGLWLQIKNGGKSWVMRYMLNGKARYMGLGSVDTCSLSEAREKAALLRKQLANGIDPIEMRKEEKQKNRLLASQQMTFAECANRYIEAQRSGWKNPKHAGQWQSTVATYANPILGQLPVDKVDLALVLKVLEPIWNSKNETASRLRGRIESILDWATVRGYRHGDNPARWKGHLDVILPAPAKVQKIEHHPALPYADMYSFMTELHQCHGMGAKALTFTVLTAARSGEVLGARWQEIDLVNCLWIIPAERMKAGKEHRIPLSDRACHVLKNTPRLAGSDFIFSSGNGSPLSNAAMTAVLRRMGRSEITVHGFRSTFRDWAAETTSYPREVIEHALAHQLKDKAEAAYQRGDLLVKRARLMDAWANYCFEKPAAGSISPIRGKTNSR